MIRGIKGRLRRVLLLKIINVFVHVMLGRARDILVHIMLMRAMIELSRVLRRRIKAAPAILERRKGRVCRLVGPLLDDPRGEGRALGFEHPNKTMEGY